jgi:hypothetical protein
MLWLMGILKTVLQMWLSFGTKKGKNGLSSARVPKGDA